MDSELRKLDQESFFRQPNATEKIKFLLEYAILAPSTHNTQPWLFKMKGYYLELFLNKNRTLAYSDPTGREALISLGCALKNLVLASQCFHLEPVVQRFCQNGLIAKIELRELGQLLTDEDQKILSAIVSRQNNSLPYRDKEIEPDFLSLIEKFNGENIKVFICRDAETKGQLAAIVLRAIETAFKNKDFTRELSQWIRPSLRKYKDGMLGNTIGIPFLLSFLVPQIIRRFDSSKMQIKMNQQALAHSPALVVITSKNDDNLSWLRSGEILEEISILAQKQGLATGVLAAPIEIGNLYRAVMSVLKTDFRPQVFFRIGYPVKTHPYSPRLPLEEVLLTDA